MIAQGNLISRGNNSILQDILNRHSSTFSQSLQNSFQAARDQVNLQSSQGLNQLNALTDSVKFQEDIRRDRRNFKEDVFRDRRDFQENEDRDLRNFDRRSEVEDRNFFEGNRRFDDTLRERRADRFQRGSLANRSFGLRQDQQDLAERRLDLSEKSTNSVIESRQLTNRISTEKLDSLRQDEVERNELQSKFDLFNDLDTFRRIYPDKDENFRKSQLSQLSRTAQSRGFQPLTKASENVVSDITAEQQRPILADKELGASGSTQTASDALLRGDFSGAALIAAEALSLAKDTGRSDLEARAAQTLSQANLKLKEKSTIAINEAKSKGKTTTSEKLPKFKSVNDALQVAFAIKEDSGITKLDITNNFGKFANQFDTSDQFRNGLIAHARENKLDDFGISKSDADRLFSAEKFIDEGSQISEKGRSKTTRTEDLAESLKTRF